MTEYPGYHYDIYGEFIDTDAFEDELSKLLEKHTYRGDDVGRSTFSSIRPDETRMTKDEAMTVAEYIGELHQRAGDAEEEVAALEDVLNRWEREDFGTHADAMIAELRQECATLEAENVRLVERVAEQTKWIQEQWFHNRAQ